jgi:hypothetical protein
MIRLGLKIPMNSQSYCQEYCHSILVDRFRKLILLKSLEKVVEISRMKGLGDSKRWGLCRK